MSAKWSIMRMASMPFPILVLLSTAVNLDVMPPMSHFLKPIYAGTAVTLCMPVGTYMTAYPVKRLTLNISRIHKMP